jgi:uncharacterized protein YndB with AHSA1/START domain
MSKARSPVADVSTTVGTDPAGIDQLLCDVGNRTVANVSWVDRFGNRMVAKGWGQMPDERHEQLIAAPPADVWRFMVDPAALSVWFGADAWLEPSVGSTVTFRFLDGRTRRGVIETIELGRTISWRWREHRGAGFGSTIGQVSTVTIQLEAVRDGTLVRIVERSMAAAPSEGTP